MLIQIHTVIYDKVKYWYIYKMKKSVFIGKSGAAVNMKHCVSRTEDVQFVQHIISDY